MEGMEGCDGIWSAAKNRAKSFWTKGGVTKRKRKRVEREGETDRVRGREEREK